MQIIYSISSLMTFLFYSIHELLTAVLQLLSLWHTQTSTHSMAIARFQTCLLYREESAVSYHLSCEYFLGAFEVERESYLFCGTLYLSLLAPCASRHSLQPTMENFTFKMIHIKQLKLLLPLAFLNYLGQGSKHKERRS